MAFFLARVSGSSFSSLPPCWAAGARAFRLRGRGQQIRRRDAHHGPVGLGEAGALERHLELRPDGRHLVPARADDAGLTIHGASLSVSSTLSSSSPSSFTAGRVSAIWKLTFARKAESPAGLGAGHQQPHGVSRSPSGPSGLRSARLLQRHRPDGAEGQAAPDEIRQLGGHGALSIEK